MKRQNCSTATSRPERSAPPSRPEPQNPFALAHLVAQKSNKPLEQAESSLKLKVLAIFGPTGVGKTAVAVAVADLLRGRGEDVVAVSCDAIQVYRGLETLAGTATPEERSRLEHRLVGFVEVRGEFSAGQFATLAHAEIDQLLAEGRRPIVVGGTGLYLRAALADLELRPPVPAEVRGEVEREIAARGPEALHGELDPDVAATVHPRDRKRVARALELQRAGIDPPQGSEQLWTGEASPPDRPRRPDDRPRGASAPHRGAGRGDGGRRGRRGGAAGRPRPAPREPPGRRSGSRSCSPAIWRQ